MIMAFQMQLMIRILVSITNFGKIDLRLIWTETSELSVSRPR
jgi:hypothetical protein